MFTASWLIPESNFFYVSALWKKGGFFFLFLFDIINADWYQEMNNNIFSVR